MQKFKKVFKKEKKSKKQTKPTELTHQTKSSKLPVFSFLHLPHNFFMLLSYIAVFAMQFLM